MHASMSVIAHAVGGQCPQAHTSRDLAARREKIVPSEKRLHAFMPIALECTKGSKAEENAFRWGDG